MLIARTLNITSETSKAWPEVSRVKLGQRESAWANHKQWNGNEATQGGTLQLKIRGGGWLDSLGSEILVGKDILGFFKNIDLDNS